ncbi:MAG: Ig domain-containing protein [Terriglobales bacterium]
MTNRGVSLLSLGCLFLLALVMTACGGGALSLTNTGGGASLPSILTTSLPGGTMGAAYAASLKASGGKAPYSWSLRSGALPAGLSLNGVGAISGTPAGQGTFSSLIFQVTDADGSSADSGGLSIKINPTAPRVLTSSLPGSEVGASYSVILQASGGAAPYKWSLKSGALPSGLFLDASTGAISGVPTNAGTVNSLVFQLTDADQITAASGNLNIQVIAGPAVLTSSLPASEVGAAYSASLQATGGTGSYGWSLKSGSLPAGLSLSGSGVIAGTPTASGNFGALVFQVVDTNSVKALSGQLDIHTATAPGVVTAFLPMDNAGTPYSFNLQANGGTLPYTWSLRSGTLPLGLSFNPATGTIIGTPTSPTISALVFQVTDAFTVSAVSNGLSLQINNAQGCSAGVESRLGTGPYAFLLKGFDINGPIALTGSFTTDGNGNILSGNEDANRSTGAQSAAITGGTYSLGADNRGCLNLTTASGTSAFRYSVGGVNGSGAFTTGQITEFDDSNGTGTRGSGILRLQNTSAFSAGLSGMYAFLFTGADASGGRLGIVGSLSASGGAFTNLTLDYDDAGAIGSDLTGGSGAYSSADSNGRGTASFSIAPYTLHWVFYVVNSTEVIFASTDPNPPSPIASGEAFATGGPFSATNLSGNYVAHGVGLMAGDIPVATITTGAFDGVSTITGGTLFQYKSGTASEWGIQGTYAVDPVSGRVVFSGNFIVPVGYLVTGVPGVTALLAGNDFAATSGVMSAQTSLRPAAGSYTVGTEEDVDYSVVNLNGDLHFNSGNFAGTQDMNVTALPFLLENQMVLATPYAFASDGTGTLGPNTAAITDGNAIYVINESPTVMHPSVTVLVK